MAKRVSRKRSTEGEGSEIGVTGLKAHANELARQKKDLKKEVVRLEKLARDLGHREEDLVHREAKIEKREKRVEKNLETLKADKRTLQEEREEIADLEESVQDREDRLSSREHQLKSGENNLIEREMEVEDLRERLIEHQGTQEIRAADVTQLHDRLIEREKVVIEKEVQVQELLREQLARSQGGLEELHEAGAAFREAIERFTPAFEHIRGLEENLEARERNIIDLENRLIEADKQGLSGVQEMLANLGDLQKREEALLDREEALRHVEGELRSLMRDEEFEDALNQGLSMKRPQPTLGDAGSTGAGSLDDEERPAELAADDNTDDLQAELGDLQMGDELEGEDDDNSEVEGEDDDEVEKEEEEEDDGVEAPYTPALPVATTPFPTSTDEVSDDSSDALDEEEEDGVEDTLDAEDEDELEVRDLFSSTSIGIEPGDTPAPNLEKTTQTCTFCSAEVPLDATTCDICGEELGGGGDLGAEDAAGEAVSDAQQAVVAAHNQGLDISGPREHLNRAKAALAASNWSEAIEAAGATRDAVEVVTSAPPEDFTAAQIQDLIRSTQRLAAEVYNHGKDISDIKSLLKEARSSISHGDLATAMDITREARRIAENRLDG